MDNVPGLAEIRAAAQRIKPYMHRTPVFTSLTLNEMAKAELFFKCENFQKTGAFKVRGALNAVFSLSEEEIGSGVATHSSGNHAAALAYAAKLRATQARIVMPKNAPSIKQKAVRSYGGIITFCEPTLSAREKTLEKIITETNARFIHPYNDYRIIAGQGTAALELLEEISDIDLVLTPVGGGGLTSGTALAVNACSARTKVIAVEPQNADDACRSFKEGRLLPSVNPQTIADGLLTSLGNKTFPIIKDLCDEIVTVNETEIKEAMYLIWERMKLLVEPSSAVPLAAVLNGKVTVKGRRAAIILSGGNVDINNLPWN